MTDHADVRAQFSDDAALVLSLCGEYLSSDPVAHNVVWSVLLNRSQTTRPGRYVWATQAGRVVGVGVQSPPARDLTLTPMSVDAAQAIAHKLAQAEIQLGGIMAQTKTARAFANTWTTTTDLRATQVRAEHIHTALRMNPPRRRTVGRFRVAGQEDLPTVGAWLRASNTETGEIGNDPIASSRSAIESRHCFLWDVDGATSMMFTTPPLGGITRIKSVYTPPRRRGHGFATANVAAACDRALASGVTPMLYVDAHNDVAKSMYRRLGFELVDEVARYKFCRDARLAGE